MIGKDKQRAIRVYASEGLTPTEISQLIGVSIPTIIRYCKEHDISLKKGARGRKPKPPALQREIVMLAKNYSLEDVAEKLKLPVPVVLKIAEKACKNQKS